MLHHNLVELPALEQINSETEGRKYLTPTGEKYPSVTTILDKTSDKSGLIAWRKRVGNEEADRVSVRASTRGTKIHDLCEKYVLEGAIDLKPVMPNNVVMFKQLQGWINKNVSDVRLVEGRLFSHKLKAAGSVDLMASYQGKPATIDYKTSVKLKNEAWILNYFLQCAMYSYMFWEMTGLLHPTIVVAIAVEEEDHPQIFVKNVKDYIDEAKARCVRYHSMYN